MEDKNNKRDNRPEYNEGLEEDARVNDGQSEDIEEVVPEDVEVAEGSDAPDAEGPAEVSLEDKVADLEAQVAKEKKEYLFLMAEFDNFRKRTLREKSEIIRNGAEGVLKGILPIVDDFERAIKASENGGDTDSLREGMQLIYNKLRKYLELNGVKEIDPEDREFDTERHEAISAIPAPTPEMKGKIIDTVEKGYTLNDKVLRHAKVVVAQ